MIAIIGLGNPGEEYADTRHNAGFKAIDILADRLHANYWKDECGALVAHCDDILLVKPQAFMNLSGGPVKNITEKYEIDDLIVVHDDIDIASGNVRVKRGGGNAGHNGLKSIDNKLGSKDYIRVRVGIDSPPGRMPLVDYVLGVPKDDDFVSACIRAADAVEYLFNHSVEEAQNKFNQSVQ
ncbi:MAG: aminoacyl-tRNA hydrolase [Coriobacteriia bacterium]|nr:aminoacyl-tRNA hydrolase [Coriobacteriia bacterium]